MLSKHMKTGATCFLKKANHATNVSKNIRQSPRTICSSSAAFAFSSPSPRNVTTSSFFQYENKMTFVPSSRYDSMPNTQSRYLSSTMIKEPVHSLGGHDEDVKNGSAEDVITADSGMLLNTLSPELVEIIKKEFQSVDVNNDGKMDAEELKQLLRKHKNVFREAEILEIAEIFYAGNAGKSVPFDRLIEAIDKILSTPKGKRVRVNSLGVGSCSAEYYYDLNHHQWKKEELDIELTHVKPETLSDKLALNAVKLVRFGFDSATGWNHEITQQKVLQRVIFLETIAAVPGMTAAIIRHFSSLRHMERDGGLINMFLEEATNERMHLLTFVTMKDPSHLFRAAVIGSQFAFGTGFLLAYIISPTFCHRFVGYVEEEACSTYTKIIKAIETAPDDSALARWRSEKAPNIAIAYWHLGEDGTVLDLMKAVRADEAEHRDVNHSVVGMKSGDINPKYDPSSKLDQAFHIYVREMMTRSPKTL